MSKLGQFAGKGIVVTGAGRGFGFATAKAFCDEGGSVALLDRDEEELGKARDALGAAGHTVFAIRADIADEQQVAEAAGEARASLRHVDVLVNNAGIGSTRDIRSVDRDEWDRTLAVNLTGPFLMVKAFVEPMVEQGRGAIVNVASLAGKRGGGILGKVAYASAKAGLIGFTRAIARELAPFGIRVNGVAPGAFDTAMTRTLKEDPERLRSVLAGIPCGKLGREEDVANAILFLAGDKAAYTIGQTMNLDGGIHME